MTEGWHYGKVTNLYMGHQGLSQENILSSYRDKDAASINPPPWQKPHATLL